MYVELIFCLEAPNFAEAQSERMANAPTDVLSGLKSLVGSPAAFNPNDAGHGKATPIAAHTTDSEATSSSLHVIAAQGEEILPEDQWHTIAGESAPISFSPEGQSSTLSTLWTIDGQAWEVIRDRLRTSIQLSDMLEDDPDCASMIPGMSIGFIKSCLHLYFARFHPQFPVIHEPTFSPNYSPAYLCLMVVAIGSTFIGTGPTSKLGQWIYRRVHRLMVNNVRSLSGFTHPDVMLWVPLLNLLDLGDPSS